MWWGPSGPPRAMMPPSRNADPVRKSSGRIRYRDRAAAADWRSRGPLAQEGGGHVARHHRNKEQVASEQFPSRGRQQRAERLVEQGERYASRDEQQHARHQPEL